MLYFFLIVKKKHFSNIIQTSNFCMTLVNLKCHILHGLTCQGNVFQQERNWKETLPFREFFLRSEVILEIPYAVTLSQSVYSNGFYQVYKNSLIWKRIVILPRVFQIIQHSFCQFITTIFWLIDSTVTFICIIHKERELYIYILVNRKICS